MTDTEIFLSKDIELYGERFHVAGFRYDGCEHFAFLTQGSDVTLIPISVLKKSAKVLTG